MAYVPPHLRTNPGAAARGPALPEFERKTQEQPKLDILYSDKAVSKLYVLSSANQKLRFELFEPGVAPFSGVNVDSERHRLCLDDDQGVDPQDAQGLDLVEKFQGLGLDPFQGQRATERLEEPFTAAIEHFAMSQDTSSSEDCCVRPELWLRFGRITFHTRRRSDKLPGPFLGYEIEREFERGGCNKSWPNKVSKELNPALPKSYFEKLENLALYSGEDKVEIMKKTVYILKVGRKDDNKRNLECHCMSKGKALEICKFKRSPIRYFVADLSWATEWDARLMLSTDVHVTALSGEEKEAANKIVSGAVMDPETVEGLRWPGALSGPVNKSSGYVLKEVRRLDKTRVRTQNGKVWKLINAQTFNHLTRAPVQPSFQADLRLQSWKTSLKDLQASEEKKDEVAHTILQTFPEILQWVYEHCL